jgi:hypothetical protein
MASQINDTLKTLTKQYVDLQRQLDALNAQQAAIREQKKKTEVALITQIRNAGLANYGITYQGKKIYVGNEHSYETLTFKFLEECLAKLYSGNTTQVKQVIEFIKQQRATKRTSAPVIKIGHASSSNSNSK